MEEDLQSLLERIRREGVERGETEASRLVTQATERAQRIVADAEAQARSLRELAEAEAEASRRRGEKALEQSARDLLLSLRKSIESLLCESLRETLDEALTPDVVADMLVRLADAYASHDMNESRVAVLLSHEDLERVAAIVMKKYRELAQQGLTMQVDGAVDKGFKVSFVDYKCYHDFTLSAIAEAIAPALKPPLNEICRRAGQAQD
jgi:V/A-type H+-transporting ATPase subunit E